MQNDTIKKYILWLVALAIVIVCIYLVTAYQYSAPVQLHSSDPLAFLPTGAPLPTASTTVTALADKPFQVLISYTDSGFEPKDINVRAGETVRFSNNSSGDLHVSSEVFSTVCPADLQGACLIQPHEFWQFTFDTPGTWGIEDALHAGKSAVVRVN